MISVTDFYLMNQYHPGYGERSKNFRSCMDVCVFGIRISSTMRYMRFLDENGKDESPMIPLVDVWSIFLSGDWVCVAPEEKGWLRILELRNLRKS